MDLYRDNIEIMILPDNAKCTADKERKNPIVIDSCPMGHRECNGDCEYYEE